MCGASPVGMPLQARGCNRLAATGDCEKGAEPRNALMKTLQPKLPSANGKPLWRKAVSLLLHMAAWAYDFLLALFVVSCVVWDELVLHGLFGFTSGAWTDHQVGRSEALYKIGQQRGMAEWQAELLSCVPELLEFVGVVTLSVLLVHWFRRLVSTTPGEWAFSVRRAPLPSPAGGVSRRVLRVAAGFAALVGVVILWLILELWVLDPV